MKEIITLHLGQCGIRVGAQFWKSLAEDHNVSSDGLVEREAPALFQEVAPHRVQPRALLIDFDPCTIDEVAATSLGALFPSDHLLYGQGSAGNLYSKGKSEGMELLQLTTEAIRKEMESCDAVDGFMLTMGLAGGTGSGFGNLLIEKLKEMDEKALVVALPVLDSYRMSKTTVGLYNEVLALEGHLDNCDLDLVVDNPSLFDIEQRRPCRDFGYGAANKILAQFLNNTSSAFRFPSQTNQSLRKLGINLVPYQRLHFCMPSLSPLFHSPFDTLSVPYVFEGLNSHLHCLCSAQLDVHYAIAYAFRGEASISEIHQTVQKFYDENSECFVQWIPQCLTVSTCQQPSRYSAFTASCIRNGSGIVGIFDKMLKGFRKSVGKMAWFHQFRAWGMEDSELLDAEASLSDIMQEYEIQTDMEDPQLGTEEE